MKSKKKRLGLKRFWRYWYVRLVRLQGHPQEIALGLALGVFAGFFPWFGFQIIVAVFLAIVFRANKIAAAMSTWVSNPITYVPIFAFNYKIGHLLLQYSPLSLTDVELEPNSTSFGNFAAMGTDFIFTLFLGCAVVGTLVAIAVYLLSLRLLRRWQNLQHSQKSHR